MLKNIIEKLHNKTTVKRIIAAVLAVAAVMTLALSVKNNNSNVIAKAIVISVLYILSLCLLSVLWRFIERRIAKKRGGEIDPLLGNMTLDLLPRLNMPVIISDTNGKIIWFNKSFTQLSGSKTGYYGKNIDQMCQNSLADILHAENSEDGLETMAFNHFFKVKGYSVNTANKNYCITIWNSRNELNAAYKKLKDKNTVIAYIMIDNLDELLQHIQEKYREVSNIVATILNEWAESVDGIIKEFQRDKYIFIFNEEHLDSFIASKFSILDKIRDVRVGSGSLPVTVSIGISRLSEGTLTEKGKDAQAALDMALQRGGDQAVVKSDNDMSFYGGKTQNAQKRTKVRSRLTANELITLMASSSNILVMGHKNPDFDCFGACVGIARMAMFCGTPVNIITDTSDRNIAKCFEPLKALPEFDHMFVGGHEALDLINHDTLLVIADVNNKRQLEAPEVSENTENIVYIDHHRKTEEFKIKPKIAYIEPSASSTCELVSEFLEQTLSPGMLNHEEANLLLAGIMLDTKQFAKNTGVRTFSACCYLQNEGASQKLIQELFKSDIDDLRREAKFESNVKIYKNTFAITTNTLKENTLSDPSDRVAAAKAADKLLTVDGVAASFALCKIDNTVYISARSAGKINVQLIIEKLGGGGHFDAAATQLKDISVNDALAMLKQAIDEYTDNV